MSANEDALREIGERMVQLHAEVLNLRIAIQDARNQALEEAARLADDILDTYYGERLAEKIRALKVAP